MVQKPSLAESARPASHNASRLYVFLKSSYLLTMFLKRTIKPHFTDARSIPTPRYYGQFLLSLGKAFTISLNWIRLIRATDSYFLPGAHNPERATPILSLYNGVFTDRFIFRHIFKQFFLRKLNLRHVCEPIRSLRYQKGKRNVIKRQKLLFLGL